MDYVCIGQFNILRNSRLNIQEKPWTRPVEREAITAYFKLARAREEIQRLKVEAKRLATQIRDEEQRYDQLVRLWKTTEPEKCRVVERRRDYFTLVAAQHRDRLYKLSSLPGFDGVNEPGVKVGELTDTGGNRNDTRMGQPATSGNFGEDVVVDDEDVDEDIAGAVDDVYGALDALEDPPEYISK